MSNWPSFFCKNEHRTKEKQTIESLFVPVGVQEKWGKNVRICWSQKIANWLWMGRLIKFCIRVVCFGWKAVVFCVRLLVELNWSFCGFVWICEFYCRVLILYILKSSKLKINKFMHLIQHPVFYKNFHHNKQIIYLSVLHSIKSTCF